MEDRTYIAIDLKSFYASAECVDKRLDPLNALLVVADPSRTEKTICLAVSPALKAYGLSGRSRLYEVIQRVDEVNAERRRKAPHGRFSGSSCLADELNSDSSLKLDFIAAMPRMARYMELSTKIYEIYLRYVSPEDMHIYSVDEVFIDATDYLRTYKTDGKGLARMMISDVLAETGITATAGIGTNLYLCKIAMDIVAKHLPPDENGVRIAELDEMSYRRLLWDHKPITDFWRVGSGISKRLAEYGMYTMGDIARCSVGDRFDKLNEDLLYKLFGVNAELLIDHAWGWEPCRISDIKSYRPVNSSLSSGQVLKTPYEAERARLIVREMTDLLSLDLVSKGLAADQLVLTIGYDVENLKDSERLSCYNGGFKSDRYGRRVPTSAHGSVNLGRFTSSSRLMTEAVGKLYDRIVNSSLLVRRMTIAANHVIPESDIPEEPPRQLDFFTNADSVQEIIDNENAALERERAIQQTVISLKKRFGRNAVLKGMNLEDGATAIERNAQIGGHKA